MNRERVKENVLELIRRTSAFLPTDVEDVVSVKRSMEQSGSKAEFALDMVAQNIGIAKAKSLPICQDTGTINFFIETPQGVDQIELAEVCRKAVVEATEQVTELVESEASEEEVKEGSLDAIFARS